MKNVHRLSLMVFTVLTAAFLAVDLPLMAQRAQQQKGAQQGAPQQKGGQQGAPTGAGTAQIDKSSPKLSPQQEQRVGQLRQQAQSLFRNLQRVLGELQRLPKRGTQGFDVGPVNNPNPRGPQQRPGPQPGSPPVWEGGGGVQPGRAGDPRPGTRGLAESDDPDGAKPITDGTSNTIGASTNRQRTSNPSGGVVDGDRLAQTGRNDAAYIKFDGLVKQAQQIVNNLEGIGNEAKALGFTVGWLENGVLPTLRLREHQQMGKELEKFGIVWPQY